jgi:hypothetical protein
MVAVSPIALTSPELQALLVNPVLTDVVFEAAAHTMATGHEAAFTYYRTAGGLAVSRVIHAADYPGYQGPTHSINMTSLTHTPSEDVRPDLAIGAHTHPWDSWASELPSRNDLRSHCDEDRVVPGVVSLIVTPRPNADLISLGITRTKAGREGQTRCQRINVMGDRGDMDELQNALRHAGLNHVWTAYDIDTHQLRDRAEFIAEQVFRSTPY